MDVIDQYTSQDTYISKTDVVAGNIYEKVNKRYIYRAVKRFFDVVLSVLALVVLSPLFLITAIAIKLDSEGEVFYSQLRVGKDGKLFKMYKFRSMCVDADKQLDKLKDLNEKDGPVFKIANDPRVTRVGRIIRKRSIDELPQLINIIKGDMSIVGPRPPLPNEVAQYTPYQMQRLSVKPGLTCYWQISGRSDISFDEWVELDCKYIRESSVWTDIKIILKTIPAVLTGRGAY
ncbi:capsular polysaccharide biosynthsis protein [[Clostridium] cellulosi]|jgi:Bacterial sugar transferase.|uniref:Capsular polysaccharide biosynthsis protein n=1 Tax=[Clostridium] cellulosi TaxID=29343 RepID=A0A078KV63_9FIRM|nr:capsular polysaccharide biosynthsis protein [[Clostridium] cellulosi]